VKPTRSASCESPAHCRQLWPVTRLVTRSSACDPRWMASAGGTVDDKPLPEVIEGLRALLNAIDTGKMSGSAAYRNRLQGAVVALEALVGSSAGDGH